MQSYDIHEYEQIIHLSFLVFILAQCSLVLINIKPLSDKNLYVPPMDGSRSTDIFFALGAMLIHWHGIGMDLTSIQLLVDKNVMPH